ncbi:YpoC family protein [Alkalicoccobacillus porphyridii]|uniref:YpoC-like domain-containing protein n=1 Tax=Alkalicoccobacillus porphyridii TaxID=2597270 RepID=A0A553ZZT0_9BACI|nr:hypothetical protein [Alkalicoccobacillus porphyridii]TSB46954.1 hypothetical protein FN960_08005 [Alkalicoccobacillus porphyridii]
MSKVPTAFIRSPFYEDGATINNVAADASLLNGKLPLFWHDINDKKSTTMSWKREDQLPQLFKRWHMLDEELSVYHEQENKVEVAKRTPEFTALLIQAVFWINHQLVPRLEEVEQDIKGLDHVPPNCTDRVAFVLVAPQRYRCYIQMRSLMEELEKLYARLRVIEARGKK